VEDIDILKHAKGYVDKMAQGVNPLTGEPIPESELLCNPRIARCLAYVGEKLDALIAAGGTVRVPRPAKPDFVYDQDKIDAVLYEDRGISLTELLRNVVKAYGESCRLTYRMVAPLLVDRGILVKEAADSDKLVASPAAAAYGIWSEQAEGTRGTYMRTLYDARGQRYVVDLLRVFAKA